jgi:hypothetical protein
LIKLICYQLPARLLVNNLRQLKYLTCIPFFPKFIIINYGYNGNLVI